MVLRAGSKGQQKSEAEETPIMDIQQTTEGAAGGVDTSAEQVDVRTRPDSRMSHSSARRPRSEVSCSSAASRASGEAQLSATLKALRVKQLERRQEMKRQEDEMKRQEDEKRRQRELQEAKDEAEEAALEARLRMQIEDDLNADRRHDFFGEDVNDLLDNPHPTAGTTQEENSKTATNGEKPTPIRHQSLLPRKSDGPTNPRQNGSAWIDDLPSAPTPPPTPSANASAFWKSIPKLTLPKYSGDPAEWPRWVGLFRALVHDQPSLSDAERMAHLQASVTGRARQTIAGMLYDGNLYTQALRALRDRFGQSGDIIRVHLEGIFAAKSPLENDAASLETFQATVHCAVTILQSQGYEADLVSTENLRRTVAKLPPYLRRKWAEMTLQLQPREPTLMDFDTWLEEQVKVALLSAPAVMPAHRREATRRAAHATGTVPQKLTCVKCGGPHDVARCREFKLMELNARMELVFANGLCISCLDKGHRMKDCSRAKTCGLDGCRRRHSRLLHGASQVVTARAPPLPAERNQNVTVTVPENRPETQSARGGEQTRVVTASACPGQETGALLQVVPITVHGKNSPLQTFALLDPGSETSFCTESLLQKLNMNKTNRTKLRLRTVDGDSGERLASRVALQISARDDSAKITVPEAWSVPALKVSRPRVRREQLEKLKHLRDLDIPDCYDGEVGLLLGANVIEAVIQQEVRVGQPGQPIAVRTAFGWALTGLMSELAPEVSRQAMFIRKESTCREEGELDAMLRDWWSTESFGTKYEKTVIQSIEDERAQQILEKTTTKVTSNRYETGLLWKKDDVKLPDNKEMATKRLISTERRLKQNPEKAEAYKATIKSYLEKGYAKKLTPEETVETTNRWYLPHHSVSNPNKPRKFRVVFDAAAQVRGTSLNSQLLTGPDLLKSLTGVLLRFREGAVALVADIQEMYHQVQIIKQDRPAQSFLWRDLNEAQKPDIYEMQVAIFGAKSSPASANYVLRRTITDHAADVELKTETARMLHDSFYMDDFLHSEHTVSEAKTVRKGVTDLLAKGGFRLVKWTSNSREVLSSIPPEEQAHPEIDFYGAHLPAEGALGVVWDAERDSISFQFRDGDTPATKRGVLKKTASIFDPLGIAAPFLITAKILMQKLWMLQLDWDEELAEEERLKWESWLLELPNLREVYIDRCLLPPGEQVEKKQIHVFCDASENAFGAVAYLRTTVAADLTHHTAFIMSKTRVAPLKQLSIVRLELQAAVLAVRLVDTLLRELPSLAQAQVTYWSDSKVVLGYIANESRRFSTFVANRVAEIHDVSNKKQWRHCPGTLNPADKCTRGTSAADLKNDHTWLNGPTFLTADEEMWPAQLQLSDLSSSDPEVKAGTCTYMTAVTEDNSSLPDASKYSSWTKYKRTTAWMLRFIGNCRAKSAQARVLQTGPLQAEELQEAEEVILRNIQDSGYKDERRILKKGQQVQSQKKTNKIADLSPFLDARGILRVGGRLKNSPLTEDARHPVLLPPEADVTRLIIGEQHRHLLHAGVEHTLNEVRQRFWIPRGRTQVKKVLHSCAFCRNRSARPSQPRMADLPVERFDATHAFSTVGLDFFGPLLVKKFRRTEKRFGLLFTCMATRAIHLEVTHSMDTDSFVMALRRFITRRGRPAKICSDNGTNLKGGERELRESLNKLNQQQVSDELTQRHITWRWNPPAAPHFGGVWERLVGSVKRALSAVLGNQVTTDEVLSTVLCEVENMVNSRPITHVTDDVRDLTALTPNHFLLGRGNSAASPGEFEHDMCSRKRWRRAQAIAEHLWSRWKKEYLQTLMQRKKWQKDVRNLEIDDVVLINEPGAPRGLWPLARVTELLPGPDGRVRAARLVTKNGATYTRPVVKIAVLEEASRRQ